MSLQWPRARGEHCISSFDSRITLEQHFRFGKSTIAPLSVVTQEIQKLFDNAPAHTVVVLSNYELYMKDVMIQGLGLESSNWEIGLSGLLGFSQVGIKSVVDQKHGK